MSVGSRSLRMLCPKVCEIPSIVDPWDAHERVDFSVQTLLSDEATRQRMAQEDLPNWDMQCDKGWHVRVF